MSRNVDISIQRFLTRILLATSFLCVTVLPVNGQIEQPPITNFTFQDHKGGTQNWMVDQAENGNIYVANNEGLLEYNGSRWRLYPTKNQTLLRAVKAHKERIYTGCYMDFGYWVTDAKGFLQYTSLTDSLPFSMIEDEQIWNILQSDQWIIFQSLNRIFLYNIDADRVDLLDFGGTPVKTFLIDDQIYFQSGERGLYKVEEGKSALIADGFQLNGKLLVELYREKDKLMGISNEGHLLDLSSDDIQSANLSLEEGTVIYSATKLKSGHIALGTISHGVIVIDRTGTVLFDYDKAAGLNDNTVLSLFEDQDENIWTGLNNGISAVFRNSGLKRAVFDESGIGTVYASQLLDGILYLGTNQGLYYRNTRSKGQSYQIVSGIEEQVWSLEVIDDQLLCGHNEGLFIVQGKQVIQKLSKPQGIWNIRKFPSNENLYLMGAYSGLYVLEKQKDQWVLRNQISNFDISAKFFEWLNEYEVIMSHEYKGVYHVRLNDQYDKAISVRLDEQVSKGRHAGLAKLGNDIYFSKSEGIWKYDRQKSQFQKHPTLSAIQSSDAFISGKLISTGQKLWISSQDYLYHISKNSIDGTEQITPISVPLNFRATKRGYEHVNHLADQDYLLGSADGYSLIDLDIAEQQGTSDLRIDEVVIHRNRGTERMNADLNEEGDFGHLTSSLTLGLSSGIQDPLHQPHYEYSLNDSDWESADGLNSVTLNELLADRYSLRIRNTDVPNVMTTYVFTIAKPWYQTLWALLGFLIIGLAMIFLINAAYTQYYKRQQNILIRQNERQMQLQELGSQQAIAKLENARLQSDIDSKNRELGISTMHTIKQNELLSTIKDKLESIQDINDLPSVIQVINENLDSKNDWSLFEKAFNEADSDFFKKVKVNHPALTPSDLKLCAYLRLNLSSKEIAPLLNISTRSVEIKRYRLRKKLDLSHEKDLVEYILEV